MNPDPTAPPGLVHALRQMAEQVPDLDVAEATWARGRQVRRRRRSTVGGALTLTVLAGIWGGLREVAQDLSLASEDRVLVTAPDTTVAGAGTADAPGVWATLTAACLQDRGWEASSTGPFLSIQDEPGDQEDPDAAVEQCSRELGVATPGQGWSAIVSETSDEVTLAANIHAVYFDVATCLRIEGLPLRPVPELTDFTDDFLDGPRRAEWHPYLAAAEQNLLLQAMQACPMPAQNQP